MFEVLYEANKTRGNFASSVIAIGDDDLYVEKFNGNIPNDYSYIDENISYLTGHVQAPTSAEREWSYDPSPPFESLSWSICHNGIITNEKDIRATYLPYIANPVDSSLIANLLQLFTEKRVASGRDIDPIMVIESILTILKGTFALSIIDSDTGEVYIARCGSILHYDDKGNFSSLPGNGFTELPEGDIMVLDKENRSWRQIGEFKISSPFLFL